MFDLLAIKLLRRPRRIILEDSLLSHLQLLIPLRDRILILQSRLLILVRFKGLILRVKLNLDVLHGLSLLLKHILSGLRRFILGGETEVALLIIELALWCLYSALLLDWLRQILATPLLLAL